MSAARRVALVTGGARGIGLGITKALLADGFAVMACGVRDEATVSETMQELREGGGVAEYCQADISIAEDRQRLMEATRSKFSALHVLVNNAGVAPNVRADILEAGEESFDRLVRINLKGPYFLTQLAARWMIEQKQADAGFLASIINVGSISSFAASVNRGDYCLTKAAVSMATKLWATRLGEFAIPVYELQPGIIRTDMTAGVTEKYDNLIGDGLLIESRWGTPEDVGRATAALARGDLPYATGNVIRIDGGLGVPRL